MREARPSSGAIREAERTGWSLGATGRGALVIASALSLIAGVGACESSTEAPQGPRIPQLVLSTDKAAYEVGDVGTLTVVNEDTRLIRHRALYCGVVERSETGGWEELGRVHETWRIPSPFHACSVLTRGFNNLEPGEAATESFEIRGFMAEEGTYRISIWETEEERVFLTEVFTVEAAEDLSTAEAARIRPGSPPR